MFELNLIKDKQKARQRRRVIFLSIVVIFFLSGLVSIFVGGLYWSLTIQVNSTKQSVSDVRTNYENLKAELDVREPRVKRERNTLIRAWNEDSRVLKDRPQFAPVLEDLAKHHPSSAEFWYNSLSISLVDMGSGPQGSSREDQTARQLLEGRSLDAQGYVQIPVSHVITEGELKSMTSRMRLLSDLVGTPRFTVDLQNEITPGGGGSNMKYAPFTMSATQTMFRTAE